MEHFIFQVGSACHPHQSRRPPLGIAFVSSVVLFACTSRSVHFAALAAVVFPVDPCRAPSPLFLLEEDVACNVTGDRAFR